LCEAHRDLFWGPSGYFIVGIG